MRLCELLVLSAAVQSLNLCLERLSRGVESPNPSLGLQGEEMIQCCDLRQHVGPCSCVVHCTAHVVTILLLRWGHKTGRLLSLVCSRNLAYDTFQDGGCLDWQFCPVNPVHSTQSSAAGNCVADSLRGSRHFVPKAKDRGAGRQG